MSRAFSHWASVALFATSCAVPAAAQWSSSTATNVNIADRAGDQAVPKIAATHDGGAWIAWFDHGGSNYDVYLQRVDTNGYEVFAHNGLLVSANAQNTSLVDWDLITDSNDDAVLAFTDTRAGGDLDVYAYMISPTGAFLWGPNGVALSADANAEANPVVAEMTDGSFVFAWSRSVTGSTARLVMQKLDAAGNPQFGPAGIEIFGGPTDDPGFAGIAPALNGEFVLSWIRDTTPFISPKHLWTQKYDAAGTALWGAAPVVVYNAASLPTAYKPDIMADGAGGAYYAWHVSVGSFFQGRVQHLDATGAAVWPTGGVEISLEPNRSDFNPAMAPLAGTGDLIVFYNKRNSAQSIWGIGGQRVSSTGQLLWGANGVEFLPTDTTYEDSPRAVPCPGGAMCFVKQGPAGTSTSFNTFVVGFKVDGAGVMQWGGAPITIASTASPKDKLRAVAAADGAAVVIWDDARVDANNVLGQNVELDGTLGVLPAAAIPFGATVNPANSLVLLSGAPSIGTTFTVGLDDPTASMPPGNTASVLVVSALPLPNFPNGVVLPGLGMVPGSAGELLVDLSWLVLPLQPGTAWAGAPVPFPFALPFLPPLVGFYVELQGALVDAGTGRVGLSNGLTIRFGP